MPTLSSTNISNLITFKGVAGPVQDAAPDFSCGWAWLFISESPHWLVIFLNIEFSDFGILKIKEEASDASLSIVLHVLPAADGISAASYIDLLEVSRFLADFGSWK